MDRKKYCFTKFVLQTFHYSFTQVLKYSVSAVVITPISTFINAVVSDVERLGFSMFYINFTYMYTCSVDTESTVYIAKDCDITEYTEVTC